MEKVLKKGHFLINHIYQDAVPFRTVVRLRHMYRIVLYKLRRNSELMSENTLQTEIFENNDNYPLEGKREWQVITSTIDIHSYSPGRLQMIRLNGQLISNDMIQSLYV